MIKAQIEQDIKVALLAGNSEKVTTLRGLKSAILYAEVAQNLRESGVSEETVIALLQKEAKKRQESADLYLSAGAEDKAAAELREKALIERYLPAQLSEAAILAIVEDVITEAHPTGMKDMGRVIAAVKQKTAGAADGSLIAKIVKEKLA